MLCQRGCGLSRSGGVDQLLESLNQVIVMLYWLLASGTELLNTRLVDLYHLHYPFVKKISTGVEVKGLIVSFIHSCQETRTLRTDSQKVLNRLERLRLVCN